MSCEVVRTGCGLESSLRESAPWLEPGAVVRGRYEISRYIGSGSVVDVVAAKHLTLAENVVLKFLRAEHLKVPGAAARFAEVARQNVSLINEHLARVYDVEAHDGIPFVVMEDLGQRHLRALLDDRGRLEERAAIDIVLQVCDALATAHALDITHGDIRPENIFFAGTGFERIKVVDCGISLRALALEELPCDKSNERISHVRFVAQPHMAPEQISDVAVGDVRSDIWAVGMLLIELLAGKAALDRDSMLRLRVSQTASWLARAQSDVPDGLWPVIVRCLSRDPEARFGDVASLAEALVPFAKRGSALSLPSISTTASGAPAASVVRNQSIVVRSRMQGDRHQHRLNASRQVSVIRTFVLESSNESQPTPTQDAELKARPVERAPVSQYAKAVLAHRAHDQRRLPRAFKLALLCVLALLTVALAGGITAFTRKPSATPRLQHLVEPRAQDANARERALSGSDEPAEMTVE